ncbi:uncharacterized protein DUF2617 [Nocardiopsis sp. Huas11]|uniref:DUF2617 family protein n=1 Tax=Nocardiopsis sp. Huas11 TaxID=2183912 RepID=UPI000EACAC09|nr:DUF2617 family protein [Nocardiopsis sp. Huas11]RKS07624.1 uncharacterized protein DUF2617 [Nocardiopsis sp. Huas11]
MRASISTPFVDTRAADLVWTLDHPLVDPLAVRTVEVPGARVELRVLGASHQVVVRPESGEGALVETVACLPGLPGGLPDSAERPLRGVGGYRFDSLVESLSRSTLTRRVERLHREVADSPGGLLVAFPGDPLAVTALHLAPDSTEHLHWRTWHAYPQSGELVTTTAYVTP